MGAGVLALALVLAGCSFPTRPGPPFACVGDPLPTTAPDSIQVHGTVEDAPQPEGISGAMEIGFVFNKPLTDPTTIASETFRKMTDSHGEFAATLTTLRSPHTAYILSQHPDYLDLYGYPALPVASDLGIEMFQFRPALFAGLLCTGCPRIGASICQGGCASLDPTTAHLIVSVVDCNDNSVAGATVTVSGSHSPVFYFSGEGLDSSATGTDEQTGAALVTGLTSGLVTIQASLGTVRFHDNTVRVTAGAVTEAKVSP